MLPIGMSTLGASNGAFGALNANHGTKQGDLDQLQNVMLHKASDTEIDPQKKLLDKNTERTFDYMA